MQRITGHCKAAIRSAIDRASTRVNYQSVPRKGRPKAHSLRARRLMAINIKKFPKATHKERLEGTGLEMCRATIDAIAKEQGSSYKLAKRPKELMGKRKTHKEWDSGRKQSRGALSDIVEGKTRNKQEINGCEGCGHCTLLKEAVSHQSDTRVY